MSGHAHFMLSKKCLALAFTIDDSLSHCYTLSHLEGRRQPAPPLQCFCPDTYKQRDTLQTHRLTYTGNGHSCLENIYQIR